MGKAVNIDTRPAVMLVNLGTPDSPAPADVRTFLRRFLTDRRIIEMPPVIWRPILEGIILRVRPRASGQLYAEIWGADGVDGSPLMHYSLAQQKAISVALGDSADVFLAMRYSTPDIPSTLDELYRSGYRRVLVVPMYSQYSQTTVASINDEVEKWQLRRRDNFELRMLRSWPTAPAYIEALATAVEAHWGAHGRPDFAAGERLVLSYHSIPETMRAGGDPYIDECHATSAALQQRLGLDGQAGVLTTFQSVFGPAKWVGPATIDTVEELGKGGCTRCDVVCPGFVADCLESLHEINILNRETYEGSGGSGFHYVPWANDSAGCIDALLAEIRPGLAGWADCR
ncbi:MAG: ferrochelatase [Varibaculum sp.]|nr:ferrochelatase [Varibaculum sp.]